MNRRYLVLFLISFSFFLVQLGTVTHAAEHAFHESTGLCNAFIAAENNDKGFAFLPVALSLFGRSIYQEKSTPDNLISTSFFIVRARSPPTI